jgi:hypothetical protein
MKTDKFARLEEVVQLLANDKIKSIMVKGRAGCGKVFVTQKLLHNNMVDYTAINDRFSAADFIDYISSFPNENLFIDITYYLMNSSSIMYLLKSLLDTDSCIKYKDINGLEKIVPFNGKIIMTIDTDENGLLDTKYPFIKAILDRATIVTEL